MMIFDDFNFGSIDANDWIEIQGGVVADNIFTPLGNDSFEDYLFFGLTSNTRQRFAESAPVNVSGGGTISFDLIFGNDSNGGENADSGQAEDVVLEYLTTGSTIWRAISTYDTENYIRWTNIRENIPTAALSSDTRFRWRQVRFNESSGDHWALDNVNITNTPLASRNSITDDFNSGARDLDDWVDLRNGFVTDDKFTPQTTSPSDDYLFFGLSGAGGQRLIESNPVNVSGGGTISFDLIFGNGSNGGENADSGQAEDVVLEYLTTGSTIWRAISTYDTEEYTTWTTITENVPNAARGGATRFRWRQTRFSESSGDHWALDNINIDGIQTSSVLGSYGFAQDDSYEENDDLLGAYDISNQQQTWLEDISGLGIANDEDWYQIEITEGYENLVVDLQFNHAAGDLDLSVYDADGNYIIGATSITNNELIDTILPGDGTYYLQVATQGDYLGNTYDLWWDDLAV